MKKMNFLQQFFICLIFYALSGCASLSAPTYPGRDLNEKAMDRYRVGKYEEGLPYAREALKISEKSLGSEHRHVSDVLNTLGLLEYRIGHYDKAKSLYLRAISIREKSLGSNHPDLAHSIENLAELNRMLGNYSEANSLYEKSLGIKENAYGSDHPEVALSLNYLGSLSLELGDLDKAEQLILKSLVIYEKTLDPDHPKRGNSLNNLGMVYHHSGRHQEAKEQFQKTVKIYEKALGSNHPDVATAISNLANQEEALGDYANAEPLYLRSLSINEKSLGPNHPAVALILNNLSGFYFKIGDYDKAKQLMHRSLETYKTALGPNHPKVGMTMNNLAEHYRTLRVYPKAESLYLESQKIIEKAYGPNHPNAAIILNNLAELYNHKGEFDKAKPLYQKSLKIKENALGQFHPEVASSLNNLGGLYFNMKDFENADPFVKRSHKIYEMSYASNHPLLAQSYKNIGWLEGGRGNNSIALENFKKALAIEDENIRNIFSIANEKQKLELIQNISGGFQSTLSLINQHFSKNDAEVKYALNLILRRKGIVFDAQSRALTSLKKNMSPDTLKDWEALSSTRSQLAQLLLNKPKLFSNKQYRDEISSLQKKTEAIEKKLIDSSKLASRELNQRLVTSETVSKNLGEKSALVEFVKVHDWDFSKGRWANWRYLSFILLPDGTVTLIDLGEARQLEKFSRNAIKSIPSIKTSLIQTSFRLNDLYKVVWKPLEGKLQGVEKLWISPDGILNLISFSTLMNDTGDFLLERYKLAYMTSGRELVAKIVNNSKPANNLLLVANPEYNFRKNELEKNVTDKAVRARNFQGHFSPLPGTQLEAENLPNFIPGSPDRKMIFTGLQATEGIVKNASAPRILHLATHGFFLDDKNNEPQEGNRDIFIAKQNMVSSSPKFINNPLIFSGLAFAGANHANEIERGDDGILTALEISGMNLYGTELVVLSACETAVGEVKNGEGVFGLRRSFALAGARNLLMSLWPVADKITADQMTDFYNNLREHTPAAALRKAQLKTIQQLKAKYGFASPALWAPFIIQGASSFNKLSWN
jgi:CHAT domain-containing protein/Tfp pilus assembly protein PilF